MKIDPINFGTYTAAPAENVKAEETNNSAIDEYDDTRMAAAKIINKEPVNNPIERKNGTVEDLIALQQSTEKMAQTYGFANVQEAQAATSAPIATQSSSAVSPVSGVSSGGINA